ncbi:lycopene cyclase domain-containing protein [Paenarthrobacter sp. Z7-10]|uniref:lycopene cyclase domain-containing protein n=1 Tax=Paenarthrobacter sp. Z7-10 TaxID=2787635 RepID=UPI002E789E1D|nr:lycopene cyclase domain-containing protein [Paenarthrobacter sp. Z7-10]MCZ2402233.1 lycopene cyclase domain-containing protein [Paenarthrobacter sp. Z7-10]
MGFLYLAVLLLSLSGLTMLDWRYRLFFFSHPVRAALVLAIGVGFFLAWDSAGIGLQIFFRAETGIMTGVLLAPELPLEELFFLTFLCQLAMVLFTALSRRAQTGSFKPAPPAAEVAPPGAGAPMSATELTPPATAAPLPAMGLTPPATEAAPAPSREGSA